MGTLKAVWTALSSVEAPAVAEIPLWKFSGTADEAARRQEFGEAITALNARAGEFAASKSFCREYLDLLRQAEGHVAAARWTEAHRTIWEATFFVNRALQTRGATRLRQRLVLAALGWLFLLLLLGVILRAAETRAWAPTVLGLAYWRYLLMGALGGITIVLWGLIKHTVGLDFDPGYAGWYYVKPLLGAVMGLIAVLVILAGFFAIQGSVTLASPLPLYLVAFLAGFSERFFIRVLDRVTTALFGGEAAVAPATVPATPKPGTPGEGGGEQG